MKTLNNEDGMILLTVLILMFIATLLGVISINSSTIEVQLAGNEKRVSTSFAAAEAGIALAIPIIAQTIDKSALTPSSITGVDMDNTQLYNEITDSAFSNYTDTTGSDPPNIRIADLGGVEVRIDIDRLYSELVIGGDVKFAKGYDGRGYGAGGGGTIVHYRINSAGTK